MVRITSHAARRIAERMGCSADEGTRRVLEIVSTVKPFLMGYNDRGYYAGGFLAVVAPNGNLKTVMRWNPKRAAKKAKQQRRERRRRAESRAGKSL